MNSEFSLDSLRAPIRGARRVVSLPHRSQPSQERSFRTLEKIEAAAVQAIETYGRDRFTTHHVAAISEVSVGTVYRYFPDRVAILHRVAPIPKNAILALDLLAGALAVLDKNPDYDPPELRQMLLDARAALVSRDGPVPVRGGAPRSV